MNEDIKAIIEKNLPAQTGEVLQKFLEQGKKDAEMVKYQAAQLLACNDTLKEKNSIIENYKKLDDKISSLVAREKLIEEKERDQKVFEATIKLQEAEKRISEMANLTALVFKSPVYRKDSSEYDIMNSYWANGNEVRYKQGSNKTDTLICD